MIKKAGQGFTWLFMLKLFSRILDFILNILVIRQVDPDIYGLTTNLGLLTNFSLFYLKICLKQTYLRVSNVNEEQTQSAINMMYLGWLLTIGITPIVLLLVVYNQTIEFIYSAALVSIAILIEGSAEPYCVRINTQFQYKIIAKAESLSVLIKTIVLFISIYFMHPLYSFGFAQLIYSIIYYYYIKYNSKPYKLEKIQNNYILPEMKAIGVQFTWMSFMKFLLQELEKIVMVIYNNPIIAGEYSLVSNIGAIIPRFIYAPLEEVSFNLFPKLQKSEQVQYLSKTIKLLNLIGITLLFAGTQSASALLQLYGQQWTTQGCIKSLQLYCFYEWIMGINGITESLVNSTLNVKEMTWYRYCLVGQTVCYCLCLFLLVDLGSVGIILSNCLSMLIRIGLSTYIINYQTELIDLKLTLPNYLYLYVIGSAFQYFYKGISLLIICAVYYGTLGLLNIYHMRGDLKQFY